MGGAGEVVRLGEQHDRAGGCDDLRPELVIEHIARLDAEIPADHPERQQHAGEELPPDELERTVRHRPRQRPVQRVQDWPGVDLPQPRADGCHVSGDPADRKTQQRPVANEVRSSDVRRPVADQQWEHLGYVEQTEAQVPAEQTDRDQPPEPADHDRSAEPRFALNLSRSDNDWRRRVRVVHDVGVGHGVDPSIRRASSAARLAKPAYSPARTRFRWAPCHSVRSMPSTAT